MYRTASVSKVTVSPVKQSGGIKVIVGSDPISHRTWTLSKDVLAKHSTYFSNLIQQSPEQSEVTLSDVEPRAFGNLVDYMHSSIYSPNTQIPNYRAIAENSKACVLGEKLGIKAYSDAAIRQLYTLFEPLARLRTSSARKSLIRASDIDYICANTTLCSYMLNLSSYTEIGVRQLFFDAVASHWTQNDVLAIGANDVPGEPITWTHVYNQYTDFRVTLATSIHMTDVWRAAILRPVNDYLKSPAQREDGKVEKTEKSSERVNRPHEFVDRLFAVPMDWETRKRVFAQPKPKIPALKKSEVSHERGVQRELKGIVQSVVESEIIAKDESVKHEGQEMVKYDDEDVLMVDRDDGEKEN